MPGLEDLVFTGRDGMPLKNPSFHKTVWRKAVHAAGLDPALRIHDLRHTCASLLIA